MRSLAKFSCKDLKMIFQISANSYTIKCSSKCHPLSHPSTVNCFLALLDSELKPMAALPRQHVMVLLIMLVPSPFTSALLLLENVLVQHQSQPNMHKGAWSVSMWGCHGAGILTLISKNIETVNTYIKTLSPSLVVYPRE